MSLPILFILSLSIFASINGGLASVPASDTFRYVNDGEFGPYIVEYGGDYRVLSLFASPFQLSFYNTTPNAFTLALRMATTRSESLFRWVWEANRGNPVGENATLTFGTDGNLVLADADGRVAWQTATANKGVTGLKLLPTGNLVLHDPAGKFIWQSFDYPTDTLLAGQSLRVGSVSKLISRASEKVNANGAYSLIMESKNLNFYYKGPNSPKPILYFSSQWFGIQNQKNPLESVQFIAAPDSDEAVAYDQTLTFYTSNSTLAGNLILSRPKYNATLSFLRLGIDGNLKIYTYYDKVDYGAWEVTFELFSRDSNWDSECQLPERCGTFGLCEDSQCVGCPLPGGIYGWSKDCVNKKLSSCGGNNFYYYKLEGVDYFGSKYTKGDGPMKVEDCGKKCSKDCKCLGYFYKEVEARCWVVYDLKTLTKVANSTHLGFIKAPK